MKSHHLLQRILTLAVILLAMLVCNTACVDSVNNEYQLTDKGVKLIPYTVTAQGPVESKATLKGKKNMIFQPGDKLIITSEDETVEGELDLKSGGGSNSGTFEGILEYHGTEPGPSDDLMLYARLVGPDDQIGTGTFVGGITGEMYEAVEQYSTLTGESTYSAMSFALSQGTTFIEFALTIEPAPVDGPYEVVVYNNETDALVSANVDVEDGETEFVVALPGGTTLNHARVTLCGCEIKFGKSSATVLSPSKTYSVAKTGYNYDDLGTPLTLEAAEEGFIVINNPCNLPFTYTIDNGSEVDRTENDTRAEISIRVGQGDKVALYGDGNTKSYGFDVLHRKVTYIVPTCDCYLYGNIMSLIDPVDFPNATTLEADYTFTGLFSNAPQLWETTMTYDDIIPVSQNPHIKSHAVRNIVLPATTLTDGCYCYLFNGTDIERAPQLNANTTKDYCYSFMFVGTRIKKTPVLPAESIADFSYCGMFACCSLLESLPSSLPAQTLCVESCYAAMFSGCISLTAIPEGFLPATEMKRSCYQYMFQGCTALTSVPKNLLHSNNLYEWCYGDMFKGCTSLTSAPDLPAERLYSSCYSSMFEGCTALTQAPELPAKTLSNYCYESMFKGCTSLETAPNLPAETLTGYCYEKMFEGCTSLNSITCLATNISANHATTNWVKDVASSGTFLKVSSMTSWTVGPDGIPENWNKDDYDLLKAFTMVAAEPGTINLSNFRSPTSINCFKNGELYGILTSSTSIDVDAGDIIKLTGDNSTLSGLRISATSKCYIYGNIMSLVSSTDYDTMTEIPDGVSFSSMFSGASNITNHPDKELLLPALILKDFCYNYMFYNSGLTKAPDLPATTLAKGCYSNMFSNCRSLVTPMAVLPATTLPENCYEDMFYQCSRLTSAPVISAESMAKYSCKDMFENSGLITAPAIAATTVAEYCCQGMFKNCTSLTTAPPALPATILAESCYEEMFLGCSIMSTAPTIAATTVAKNCCKKMFSESGIETSPILPAETLVENCYEEMFSKCTSLTTASEIKAKTLAPYCFYNMFLECSSLTSVPALKATTMVDACCAQMFMYCTSLETVPIDMLPAENLAYACYLYMFGYCSKLVNTPQLNATNLAFGCYAAMFEDCTLLSAAPVLPAETLQSWCYARMFYNCPNLEVAPDLPASTLVDNCYSEMFTNCTKLSSIKCLATDITAEGCLMDWLTGVAAEGTFYKAPTATWAEPGAYGIPSSGWTVQDAE